MTRHPAQQEQKPKSRQRREEDEHGTHNGGASRRQSRISCSFRRRKRRFISGIVTHSQTGCAWCDRRLGRRYLVLTLSCDTSVRELPEFSTSFSQTTTWQQARLSCAAFYWSPARPPEWPLTLAKGGRGLPSNAYHGGNGGRGPPSTYAAELTGRIVDRDAYRKYDRHQ